MGKEMRSSLARGRTRSRSINKKSFDDRMKIFKRPKGPSKRLVIKKERPFSKGKRPERGRVFASIEKAYCPRSREGCQCSAKHVTQDEFDEKIQEREALCEKEWYPAWGYYVTRNHEGDRDDGWYPYEVTYDDE